MRRARSHTETRDGVHIFYLSLTHCIKVQNSSAAIQWDGVVSIHRHVVLILIFRTVQQFDKTQTKDQIHVVNWGKTTKYKRRETKFQFS